MKNGIISTSLNNCLCFSLLMASVLYNQLQEPCSKLYCVCKGLVFKSQELIIRQFEQSKFSKRVESSDFLLEKGFCEYFRVLERCSSIVSQKMSNYTNSTMIRNNLKYGRHTFFVDMESQKKIFLVFINQGSVLILFLIYLIWVILYFYKVTQGSQSLYLFAGLKDIRSLVFQK